MARMRTFIAVDLGKAVRDRCLSLQDTLARSGAEVKWVEEGNLHLTLLFLGEVEDRALPELCRAVADCCAEQNTFTLSIESVGCFPNPRRPRIVWAGVGAGSAELIALHDALEPPLLDLGCYRREARQYTPHVTLGRVEGDGDTDVLAAALTKQTKWRGGETEVREVCVFSSELRPKGPVYTVLSRAKLLTR
jgi:RNA 2',3'-cyclic 3'-phosphodiesterase